MEKVKDIVIRFSDSNSETWLNHWAAEIPKIDWSNVEGIRNFKTFLVYKVSDPDKTPLCQLAYYTTKTTRVVFISSIAKHT